MRARPSASSFVARASLVLVCSSFSGKSRGSILRAVSATEVPGRWGQSAVLLTSAEPTLLVVSGKTFVAGQTLSSTPTSSSILSLDLSNPIDDLLDPPWLTSSPAGPTTAFGSALALSSTSALFFGGDATGDATTPVQSGHDSSWLLSYFSTSSPAWKRPSAEWTGQPARRELAYAVSATNGSTSRAWIYGGLRSDGSGVGLDEMWEVQLGVGNLAQGAGSGAWSQWSSSGLAPPAMWDGQAVLVPSPSGGLPSVYLIGGVQQVAGLESLTPLNSIWVFTPSASLGSGLWTQFKTSGTPPPRRGHVAVAVGAGKIWIQGGRSLDGLSVMSDGAVLDTRTGRWTTTAEGSAVWGHSAVIAGETVLLAFGYGLNAPAPSSLTVYSPSSDTFLASYQPSFILIPDNPKSRPLTSPISPSSPTSPAESAVPASPLPSSTLVTEGSTVRWMPLTSTAPISSSDPQSTLSPSSAPWVAPGVPQGSAIDQAPDPTSPTFGDAGGSKDPSPSVSKSEVAGAVVGSLLGAVALVAVGLVVARRRQRRAELGPYAGRTRRAGYGGGKEQEGDASGSLMAEAGAAGNSEAYTFDKALPPLRRSQELGRPFRSSFLAAVGLAGRTPKAQEKGRFAMLEDEESEIWNSLNLRRQQGWTTFDDDAEEKDSETSSMRGRGGVGVWDGYNFGLSGAGSVVSDTVQSGRSFLTGALGGFVPIASQEPDPDPTRSLDGFGDAGLTPIHEEYGDEDESHRSSTNDHTATEESAGTRSAGTHQTVSTGPSTGNSSGNLSRYTSGGGSRSTPSRAVSSPSTSLYGSGFYSPAPSPALALAGAKRPRVVSGLSRSSSGQSDFLTRSKSSSSWLWGRLAGRPLGPDEPTTTANERIRDPAPAPKMGIITEGLQSSGVPEPSPSYEDPFADPAAPASPSADVTFTRPSELGLLPLSIRPSRALRHDRSISSTTSSHHSLSTVTSSVLEERMRTMDVVQRLQTGSYDGSQVSAEETTPRLGSGEFGRLPSSDEEEEVIQARREHLGAQATGRLVFAGSAAGSILTADAPTSPSTKRLVGPRPPPISVAVPSKPSAALRSPPPLTAGAAGVRAMVQRFEAQRTEGGDEGMPKSTSMSSLVQAPTSLTKAMLGRRTTLGGVGETTKGGSKFGLVRKPVLYVANPDEH